MDLRDNILYDTQTNTGGGTTGKSYAVGLAFGGAYSNITSNYNDIFTAASGLLCCDRRFDGRYGRTTLAAWRTETGKDTNSISADPLFNTTTNLQPQIGSPVLAAGQSIAGITSDILGVLRGSPPTIGAYEQGLDRSARPSPTRRWETPQAPPTALFLT